jgi:preprotein translocase subunit SecA
MTVSGQKNHKMSKYTTLNKKIVKPLKEICGYIDEEKVERNRKIFFTEDGITTSKFLF